MGDERGYEFVEGATSDLAFVAHGPTLEAAFAAAGEALLAATLERPDSVERRERRSLALEEPDLELLLMRFLNELVYLRDAESLLLHPERILVHFASARIQAALFVELAERQHRVRVEMLRRENF